MDQLLLKFATIANHFVFELKEEANIRLIPLAFNLINRNDRIT
jgi:hypothetical protein